MLLSTCHMLSVNMTYKNDGLQHKSVREENMITNNLSIRQYLQHCLLYEIFFYYLYIVNKIILHFDIIILPVDIFIMPVNKIYFKKNFAYSGQKCATLIIMNFSFQISFPDNPTLKIDKTSTSQIL